MASHGIMDQSVALRLLTDSSFGWMRRAETFSTVLPSKIRPMKVIKNYLIQSHRVAIRLSELLMLF